jgi:hypothetical protein
MYLNCTGQEIKIILNCGLLNQNGLTTIPASGMPKYGIQTRLKAEFEYHVVFNKDEFVFLFDAAAKQQSGKIIIQDFRSRAK